ncbi:MAG: isochorismatase family protein [Pseudomonadota bacterium]
MGESLDVSYRRAFAGRLQPGDRAALLLIDFVQAYFEPTSPLYADVDAELERALALRDTARKHGIFVVYTNVVYQPGTGDGGRFFEKVAPLESFEAGNPLGAWPASLVPGTGELIVSKQYPSAFFGTSLASTLTARGIDTVVLTGLTTSGCVRATCVDAVSHGFIPLVVGDACGDRHASPHEANLFDMQAKYAEVIDAAAAAEYLASVSF